MWTSLTTSFSLFGFLLVVMQCKVQAIGARPIFFGPQEISPRLHLLLRGHLRHGTGAHGQKKIALDGTGEQDVIAIAMVYVPPMRCGTGKRLRLFSKAPRQKKSNVYRDSEAGPVKA